MYHFYLGCYTHQNTSKDAEEAKGIYLLTVSDEGKLVEKKLVHEQLSPSYFYLTKDKKVLYAVTEAPNVKGDICAYQIDPADYGLKLTSRRQAAGGGLCHVTMDPEEKFLLVTCYDEATIQSYPIENSTITPMFSLRHHMGQGPVLERQEAAHAHSITFTPEGAYLVVCDLGTDMLNVYTINPVSGKIHRVTPLNFKCPAGCGPRHMVFSPDGKMAYVACELSSEILILRYHARTGFELAGKVSTRSPEFSSNHNYPAAIRISKDGRHLYLSNRGEDTIAVFRIYPEDGSLALVGSASTRGWYPRDFVLSEDERLLLAANQLSDNLSIFKIDQSSGMLTLTDEVSVPQKPIALMEI
ncbi:MAG: lactonase family protein [Firmicutes bacterium]|nr:lactonase family protein [Bacillota bacterium]